MVFLADFIGRHEVSVTSEPLLLFRRGGISHQIDRYGSWREYLKHVVGFIRMLRPCNLSATPRPRRADYCLCSLAGNT